ncbi:MAG: thiaminase II [Halanaerobiales bacterium]
MDFTELVQSTEDIWKKLLDHPFIKKLYSGDLSKEKFKFYLKQDFYYLDQSMRNMGLLIAKAEDIEVRRKLINILYSESEVEFSEYKKQLLELNIGPEEAKNIKASRANISYTNYLLAVSSQKSFKEGMAALLPCYWSYLKIAEANQDKLKKNKNKYYLDWATVYTRVEYKDLVNEMISILEMYLDESNFDLLQETFKNSLKFEFEFFTDMYKLRKWQFAD